MYALAKAVRVETLQDATIDIADTAADLDRAKHQIRSRMWLADRFARDVVEMPAPAPKPVLSPLEAAVARRAQIDAALARRRKKRRAGL
jgi:hypothetical protein